jgi:hypothetical protein
VKLLAATGALIGAAAFLEACAGILGVEEKHAGTPATAADAASNEGDDSSEDASGSADGNASSDAAIDRRPLSLGQYEDPVLAVGPDELVVNEIANDRSRIILIPKANPTKPKTIYDQSAESASTRVSTIGVARSKVWFTTSDGKLHDANLDGTNPEVVDQSSSSIVVATGTTLWTASPDDLSNAPTLHWVPESLEANTPEAALALDGPVMFSGADDFELAFASRTTSARWTLERFRPQATTKPHLTYATFDAYPSWVTFDTQRAFVYSEDEGTIVAWPRTEGSTSTTVLTGIPHPIAMKSDGTRLVMRSQTALSSCTITDCAKTLTTIPVATAFTVARYLEIDADWVYFFHAKSDSGPMTLVRVPR